MVVNWLSTVIVQDGAVKRMPEVPSAQPERRTPAVDVSVASYVHLQPFTCTVTAASVLPVRVHSLYCGVSVISAAEVVETVPSKVAALQWIVPESVTIVLVPS